MKTKNPVECDINNLKYQFFQGHNKSGSKLTIAPLNAFPTEESSKQIAVPPLSSWLFMKLMSDVQTKLPASEIPHFEWSDP